MSFPTTSVLDSGVRADEGPPPSASWSSGGVDTGTNGLQIVSNEIAGTINESGRWGTDFGPDTEVYATVNTLPAEGGIMQFWLRLVTPGSGSVDGYRFQYVRQDTNPGFLLQIFRVDDFSGTQLGAAIIDTAGAIASGIKLGGDMIGSDLTAYVNRSGTWVSAGTRSDSTYTAAGPIAVRTASAFGFKDFGGGTSVADRETLMLSMGMLGTGRV